jgi:hypothetical protein
MQKKDIDELVRKSNGMKKKKKKLDLSTVKVRTLEARDLGKRLPDKNIPYSKPKEIRPALESEKLKKATEEAEKLLEKIEATDPVEQEKPKPLPGPPGYWETR